MYAIGAIVVVCLALVGTFAFCIYKKCMGGSKKKGKKVRERKGGGRRRVKKDEGEGEVRTLAHFTPKAPAKNACYV